MTNQSFQDNATIPYIKNIYWYHTLTQYLESQQEDWRYYDMVSYLVFEFRRFPKKTIFANASTHFFKLKFFFLQVWVTDLDAPEDQCKVFVDAAVERVSCDFLLPTLCEMDEHVNLSVDFLKSEFIYAIAAGAIGILLIGVVST
jgi:hypothetical protein